MEPFEFRILRHREDEGKTGISLGEITSPEDDAIITRFSDPHVSDVLSKLPKELQVMIMLSNFELRTLLVCAAQSAFDAGREYEKEIREL